MKASDLKPGDVFSLTKRKNAARRTVSERADDAIMVIAEPKFRNPPKDQIGKLLIILQGCGQLILAPDTEVFKH